MMKFLIFNREETLIGFLKGIESARQSIEINGEDILEIYINEISDVEKGYSIVFKDNYGYWHEYKVKEIEKSHAESGIFKYVFCESSFYETNGDYVEDKRPQNVTANIALENALLTTRWQTGIIDDLGINSTNFYHISAKEAIQNIAEVWKGEIRTRVEISGKRITARYIDLLQRRGTDRGKRFTYTKDLTKITKIIHGDDVITALYGYGKGEEVGDGYGRRLDFAELNNGVAYVENIEARDIWGRPNGDGTKSHVFGKIEFDDCEDSAVLIQLTQNKLSEVSTPLITYEGSVTDLKSFGFEHEGVELGDKVAVIDREFAPELRLKARVIKLTKDLLYPENNQIILGNFPPSIIDDTVTQEMYISNFRSKTGVWDRANQFNRDGSLNTTWLDGTIDVVKNKLIATNSGWRTDDNGNIILEASDGTSAMMLSGAGFMIADSKHANGEWDWRTFGDGNGFIADTFIGGVLQGGKVKFDLTNGTLLVGNDIEDFSILWDGTKLQLNVTSLKIQAKDVATQEDIENIELTPGPQGDPGLNGLTAYEVAVNNGFVGSESEWLASLVGDQGPQGIQGQVGADGVSTYFYVRYSQNSDGNPMVTSPVGAIYIGVCSTTSQTAPTLYTSYAWSKIKGEQGVQGIQGTDGQNGQPSYLHIKYSDDGISFTQDGGETPGKWLGTYVDSVYEDSTTFEDYAWAKIEGPQGPQGLQGLQGIQGQQGDQGIQGPSGSDGVSSYTHIAYATNSTGTTGFSTSDPTGKTYMGVYVDSNPTDSTNPNSYNWSLIQGPQGPQGNQGTPGTPGDDGQTPYFHVAWATAEWGSEGFSTTNSQGKTYIGVYTDYNPLDNENPQYYSWSKIQGPQGEQGEQGIQGPQGNQGVQGPAGADGQSLYTWIKYADTPTSGMSDSPTGKTYIGLAYNKTTSIESNTYSDYTWSLIKGDTGATGPAGSNGESLYTWVKYADTPTSGMSDDPTGKMYIGLAYNKTVATESTNYGDYSWSEMPQNIDLGGTNLFVGSDDFDTWGHSEITSTVETGIGHNNLKAIFGETIDEYQAGVSVFKQSTLENPLDLSVFSEVTFGMYVYFDSTVPHEFTNARTAISIPTSDGIVNSMFDMDFDVMDKWVYVSHTVPVPENFTTTFTNPNNGTVFGTRVTFIAYGYGRIGECGLKLEPGNKGTYWSPAPEDTQSQIDNKADQTSVDDLQTELSDLESIVVTTNDLNEIINSINTHYDLIAQNEEDVIAAKEDIGNLLSRVAGIDVDLDDAVRKVTFVDTYMVEGDEGLFIGTIDGTCGIRFGVDPDAETGRIDFVDGNDNVIAFINSQVMQINNGIFVQSAQIGEHQIATISGGHTIFTWVDPAS